MAELKTIDTETETETLSVRTSDSETLALLGKKQVLKRRFGFWSLFAFAICELITWETVLALFSQGFNNGGPAGLVYGFIIAWLSTLSVYTVISELASIAPIACGQYYWVYILAPDRYKKSSSYVIGWLTSLAWIATIATESLFAGTMIQGVLSLRYKNYDGQAWQGTLLTWAVIAVNIFINTVIPGALPKVEIMVMIFHLGAFVAIMATLLSTANIQSASFVFTKSLNEGGWSTQGLSYCVGFLGNVATFVGADASVHMAEEVDNAARNLPRAICSAMIVNGLIGFAMMITTLFCLDDVNKVINTKLGFPFIQAFADAVDNVSGAVAMTSVVVFLTWACALGITTTASRMTWSFARDKGTPLDRFLSHVDKRTRVPVVAVFTTTILAALLTLIYIGSDTAFNDVISLTITGFYGSYLLPCALLLYHRVKGNIHPRHSAPEQVEYYKPEAVATGGESPPPAPARLTWGPWRIPGLLGTINNAYACVYMVFVIFWSVWPPKTPVNAKSMNYSVVVTGGVMILSAIWYFVRARHVYKGPVIDESVAETVRRRSSVIVA